MPEQTFEEYMPESIGGEIIDKNALIYTRPLDLWSERRQPIIKRDNHLIGIDAFENDLHIVEFDDYTSNSLSVGDAYKSLAHLYKDGSLGISGNFYNNLEEYDSAITDMMKNDSGDKCILPVLSKYYELFPVLSELDDLRKEYFK